MEYTEVVWAKVKGFPFWPAQLMCEYVEGQLRSRKGYLHVEFCSTGECTFVSRSAVKPFDSSAAANPKKKGSRTLQLAIGEACELAENLEQRKEV